MKTIRIGAKLVKIENDLILLDFEFVDFGDEVDEENVLGVFWILVGKEFLDVIFGDFQVIILVYAVKNELQDAFVVH
jgi:hypothetical protein